MGLMDALREKFSPRISTEDRKNLAALDESEKVNAIRARAKSQADEAKKKKPLTWSGKEYAGRIKGTVDELER